MFLVYLIVIVAVVYQGMNRLHLWCKLGWHLHEAKTDRCSDCGKVLLQGWIGGGRNDERD